MHTWTSCQPDPLGRRKSSLLPGGNVRSKLLCSKLLCRQKATNSYTCGKHSPCPPWPAQPQCRRPGCAWSGHQCPHRSACWQRWAPPAVGQQQAMGGCVTQPDSQWKRGHQWRQRVACADTIGHEPLAGTGARVLQRAVFGGSVQRAQHPPTWEESGRMAMPARPPTTSILTGSTGHHSALQPSTHLGEERQDGDAGVAAHHGHVHLGHIQAGLLRKEGLGTHLRQVNAKARQVTGQQSRYAGEGRAEEGRAGQGREAAVASRTHSRAAASGMRCVALCGTAPQTQRSMTTAHAPRPGWSHPARASHHTHLRGSNQDKHVVIKSIRMEHHHRHHQHVRCRQHWLGADAWTQMQSTAQRG